jgi:hypothetical protein
MAIFTITVYLDNAAFDDDNQELARIIAEVSKKVANGSLDDSLRDINNEYAGSFSVDEDEDEDEDEDKYRCIDCLNIDCVCGERTFDMSVNLDNAAFEDNNHELARIIAKVSKKVANGSLDDSLRDINGNTVGSFTVDNDDE